MHDAGWQSVEMNRPISLNNLFFNAAGQGRHATSEYQSWKREAAWRLTAARLQPIIGPFEVDITLTDKTRVDLDNGLKALIDSLVRSKVVGDDRILRHITAGFGKCDGSIVRIRPFTGGNL